MNALVLEVMCLDCEEQWRLGEEPVHCICEDPMEDAWLVFLRDDHGSWVKVLMDEVDFRHDKEGFNA